MTKRRIIITIIFFEILFTGHAIEMKPLRCKWVFHSTIVSDSVNGRSFNINSGDTNRFFYVSFPPLRPFFAQSVVNTGVGFNKWMAEVQLGITYGEPFIRPLSTFTSINTVDISEYELPFGETLRAVSWYVGTNGSRTLFKNGNWSIGLPLGYSAERRLYRVYGFPETIKYLANPTIRVLKRDWHRAFTGIRLIYFPKKESLIFHELSFLFGMSVVKDYYVITNNTVSIKNLFFSELYFEMTYSLAFRWKPSAWRKRKLVE